MNNINKVQTQNSGGKPKQPSEQIELNFNDLFSSAMGQKGPNSQLNSIESQLRESLFKQDKPKKNNDNTINAEAAQAAMWAQRNWMQTASAPQIQASVSASAGSANATKSAPPEQDARNQTNATDNRASDADGNKAGNESVSKQASQESKPLTDQTDAANSEAAPEQAAQTAKPVESVSPTPQQVSGTGTASSIAQNTSTEQTLTQAATVSMNAQADSTKATASDLTTKTATAEQLPRNPADTGNAKVDAMLNNGSVNTKVEIPTQAGTTASGPGNPNTVATQLAPQIAQQAQNMGGKLEAEGLKVGQKILATGSLQTAANPNGIAAGTNGLTGTLGTSTPQALIKTPVNQPGFAKELGQTVNWAIGKNMSTVDIRVNPETFGPMNMRLVQKGQQVQLVIRTQDEASANLLTQALGGLKEVLAQNGLQLNQVQIQHGNPQNGQANGQANNGQAQFDQGNGQNRNGGQQSANGGSNEQDNSAATAAPASPRKADGKLDLFA